MQIATPLFEQLTALDGIGPHEVLQRLPDATVVFVGDKKGEIRTDNGFLGLTVDAGYDEVPTPDVIVVPGGIGTRAFVDGEQHDLLDWPSCPRCLSWPPCLSWPSCLSWPPRLSWPLQRNTT